MPSNKHTLIMARGVFREGGGSEALKFLACNRNVKNKE